MPARKHGKTYDPEFRREYYIWVEMRARCRNPKHHNYADYGGRGILVCNRWDNFDLFISDMGRRPPGLTLDRWPNNDGNYEPGNCRWATRTEQVHNRREISVPNWRKDSALRIRVAVWRGKLGASALSRLLNAPRSTIYGILSEKQNG